MTFEKLREQQPELAGEIDALLSSVYASGSVPYYMPPPSQPAEKQITDGGNVPWRRRNWRRYGLGGDVEAGSTLYRERPVRPATTENNAKVPFWQAMIDSITLSFAIVMLCIAIKFFLKFPVDILSLIVIGGVSFAIALYFSWRERRVEKERLCWLTEELVGRDIDGDGAVGQPTARAEPNVRNILVRRGDADDDVYVILLDGRKVIRDKVMEFVSHGYSDGYTFETAMDYGLTRDDWDSVINTMVMLNLVSPKRQGVDASALRGVKSKTIVDKMNDLATVTLPPPLP